MADTAFISAGYFLTRPCPRPTWAHGGTGLLPESIVTLSTCLIDVVPSLWPSTCEPPCRPSESALASLGISSLAVPDIEAWTTAIYDAAPGEWPVPFATLEMLHAFVDHFVARDANVLLVGAALPTDAVAAVLAQQHPSMAASERYHAIRRALTLDATGTFIGYEVLGDGITENHSIVCTGGEVALRDSLGISPNSHGLLDSLDDARRAAAWASEDGHAEPVDYYPWRLCLYPRHA